MRTRGQVALLLYVRQSTMQTILCGSLVVCAVEHNADDIVTNNANQTIASETTISNKVTIDDSTDDAIDDSTDDTDSVDVPMYFLSLVAGIRFTSNIVFASCLRVQQERAHSCLP